LNKHIISHLAASKSAEVTYIGQGDDIAQISSSVMLYIKIFERMSIKKYFESRRASFI
jgi:hypothetical protein